MIELLDDGLRISFPEVHEDAVLLVDFQRTLRIPDDGEVHPLPPGLGRFPLRDVDDHAKRVPASWREHGGVMMPMHQSEALWIEFTSSAGFPFMVKVAAGKINAATGDAWDDRPSWKPQDYLVVPRQPWLDGYCVEDDEIRQFVAMPLGEGFTAEEQLTRHAEHGVIQLLVHPLKREAWERQREAWERQREAWAKFFGTGAPLFPGILDGINARHEYCIARHMVMGLAAGGRMKQKIYEDRHARDDWNLDERSRCFVHIANSAAWRAITGSSPPTRPPSAREYSEAGLPWFDLYDEGAASLPGSKTLRKVKSVAELGAAGGKSPLPENHSAEPKTIRTIRIGAGRIREGGF